MKVEVRVKDTRAALVKHFDGKTWHFPGALFPLTEEERANAAARTGHWVSGSTAAARSADSGDLKEGSCEPGDQPDDEPDHYAVAAE